MYSNSRVSGTEALFPAFFEKDKNGGLTNQNARASICKLSARDRKTQNRIKFE